MKLISTTPKKSSGISVLSVTLDDLLKWENINRLDYLKIDTEGAEEEILVGARNSIMKFRPIIQVEVLVKRVNIPFDRYKIFQAPKSINVLVIPEGNDKIKVVEQLGWQQLI